MQQGRKQKSDQVRGGEASKTRQEVFSWTMAMACGQPRRGILARRGLRAKVAQGWQGTPWGSRVREVRRSEHRQDMAGQGRWWEEGATGLQENRRERARRGQGVDAVGLCSPRAEGRLVACLEKAQARLAVA